MIRACSTATWADVDVERRVFTIRALNDDRTLYEVQAILGHSSSKVTERYAHLSTTKLQQASASASARLTGNVVKSPE